MTAPRVTRHAAASLAVLLGACNQTPIETPVRSFDRPSDVALTCIVYNTDTQEAGFGGPVYEPRPLSACAPLAVSETHRDPADPTGETIFQPELRALVANSARGEVALVNVPQAVLIDLDRVNPGYNFVPVGRLPEAIRASRDGCVAVTANVDSCDLALLDLPRLYNMPFVPNRAGQSRDFAAGVVRHIELWAGGRRLEARPSTVELSPLEQRSGTASTGTLAACRETRYQAWVALPGCQAVVQVELSLGGTTDPVHAEIVQAISVTPAGATVLADPASLECPAECSGGAAPTPSTDPLAPSTGRLPEGRAAPITLALDDESQTQRLFIGDAYGERVDVVALDPAAGAAGAPRAVRLEAGTLGVHRLRVSPRTPAGKFLYAVARDGTVHVVDVDREVECETNPDPTAFGAVPAIDPAPEARRLGCLPLGHRATPPRAGTALGPGIALPNGTPARDVAFVHLDEPIPPTTGAPFSAQPALLVGDFAWIAGSDGRAHVVQIYDGCPQPNDPQQRSDGSYTPACDLGNAPVSRLQSYANINGDPYPSAPYPIELERLSHRLRNGARRFLRPNNEGDAAGSPRVSDPTNPTTVTVEGSPAAAGQGVRLPSLEAVVRRIAGITPPDKGGASYFLDVPDPARVRAETWTLAWEGVLPGTERAFGRVCAIGDADCPRGSLTDAGAVLCARGVQAGDKVDLLGCEDDEDCLHTQVCARDPGAPLEVTRGLCLDAKDEGEQVRRCGLLLRAERRYRVTSARQGAVLPSGRATDVLELSEIYEPEYLAETHECTSDEQCADVTVPSPDTAVARPPLPTTCLPDWDGVNRCLRACDPTRGDDAALCGPGYLCAESSRSTPTARDHRCLRAPRDIGLFADCLRYEQRYRVRGGDAWTVVGSTSGLLSVLQPDPTTRECSPPPLSSELVRLRNPRIAIDAPLCPQQPDPTLGIDALTRGLSGASNVCRIDTSAQDRVIHFENALVAFALRMPRNPTGLVPAKDTSITFQLVGGGFPLGLVLGISGEPQAQAPRSMVVAPDGQTVFVVDEGKGTAATALRGQLLRLVSALQAIDPAFRVR